MFKPQNITEYNSVSYSYKPIFPEQVVIYKEGQRGQAGLDGKDGVDGKDGADGLNATTAYADLTGNPEDNIALSETLQEIRDLAAKIKTFTIIEDAEFIQSEDFIGAESIDFIIMGGLFMQAPFDFDPDTGIINIATTTGDTVTILYN